MNNICHEKLKLPVKEESAKHANKHQGAVREQKEVYVSHIAEKVVIHERSRNCSKYLLYLL